MSTTTISDLLERLGDLPPEGIDLRAELAAWRAARVGQALEQVGGDMAAAARLLRMSRLDLMRLEALCSEPVRFQPRPPVATPPPDVGHVAGGVAWISAAVILRLAAEGLKPRRIAARLGCNPYVVERVLRRDAERKVRALDAEGLSPAEIADRLKWPLPRVCRYLAVDELAGGKA